MGVQDEVEEMATKKYGPNSAKQFVSIAQKFDPEKDIKAYLDECVNLLSRFLGVPLAKQAFEPFYKKYGA